MDIYIYITGPTSPYYILHIVHTAAEAAALAAFPKTLLRYRQGAAAEFGALFFFSMTRCAKGEARFVGDKKMLIV